MIGRRLDLTVAELDELADLLDTDQSMILPGHQEREDELAEKAWIGSEHWTIERLREIADLRRKVERLRLSVAIYLNVLDNAADESSTSELRALVGDLAEGDISTLEERLAALAARTPGEAKEGR